MQRSYALAPPGCWPPPALSHSSPYLAPRPRSTQPDATAAEYAATAIESTVPIPGAPSGSTWGTDGKLCSATAYEY
ncbi:hypothetical protein OG474_04365 [Kribbella sp. NBC_01505]|uniref:hypothetical protein n=1 Tax=Kribbella sp. NBC_01505 TaxID=2903580 RepID=UPI003867087A